MTQTLDARLFGTDVSLELSEELSAYWTLLLRLVVGWWFFHAGISKYAGEAFSAKGWLVNGTSGAPAWLHGFLVWVANTPWMLEFTNVMIPLGETLIGLGLLLGALTRLAAFFGAFLMVFFYLGNAAWSHGYVNGDLMGLLLFVTLIVLGAGRVLGVDALLERTRFVRRHSWLRYLLA